jgi:large subunit ribosomal protein L10
VNRDQKASAIADIAGNIDESQAIFAVDYRGITVAQIAELRSSLRAADATFTVVKNSLTERAADQAGAETLKEYLAGPTALTFVRGDAAVAAKAIADYARATQLLPFKGGLMDGAALDVDQIRALSRLPSREVLYGQLVGVVASPVSGLVRTLGALLGGLAVALGQVREKKESGEIPAGEPPAAAEPAQESAPAEEAPAAEAAEAEAAPAPAEAEAAPADAPADEPAEAAPEQAEAPGAETAEAAPEQAEAPAAETAETAPEEAEAPAAEAAPEEDQKTEPAEEPEQKDDNNADAAADDATAESGKED